MFASRSLVVFRELRTAHPSLERHPPDEDLNQASADYWRARESAERAAASRAACIAARNVHQQLALGYAARVRRLHRDG